MKKVAVFGFLTMLLIVTGFAQADGHSELEEENAKLQQALATITADRDRLSKRLRLAIANAKTAKAELNAQLSSSEANRTVLRESLSRAIAHSKSSKSDLNAHLSSANADRDVLRNRLRRAIAHSKSSKSDLNAQLSSANADRDVLRNRLRRAIAHSKSTKADLTSQLSTSEANRNVLREGLSRSIAHSKSSKSELNAQISTANADRDVLRNRLRRAIAHSKASKSDLNTQLTSANADRNVLRNRLRRAIAHSKATKSELQDQLTAVRTRDANWASELSSSLQSSIGGLQGTSITTNSDDSVTVQVGNNGLFSSGGIALSRSGANVLSQIAEQLVQRDSTINVVGHSDNIPVGDGGRFESNEALSYARATSTLQFLLSEGVPVERLFAAGYGANYPIASNDTAEGRAQNRRVDIVLRPR